MQSRKVAGIVNQYQHGVCVCTHLRSEKLLTLDERAARLHQVIYDDHVTALGLPLLQAHDALGTVAHFGADDLQACYMRA